MTRSLFALIALGFALAPRHSSAQRVDLTGPFVHLGGVAGSVTRDSGPVDDNHSGPGWGAGAGVNFTPWFSVLGNYSIYAVKDQAANTYNLEQSEVGMRLRIGGERTPVVFYVEGGGALRRATLSALEVYGTTPPPSIGDRVDVGGWAGWFGPGAQFYFFGPRVPLEVAVSWGWGKLSRARIDGATSTIPDPIAITTLRLRAGMAAAIF